MSLHETDVIKVGIHEDKTGVKFSLYVTATPSLENPSGLPSWYAQYGDWLRHLSERKEISRGSHTVKFCTACYLNAAAIHETWGNNVTFEDELAESVYSSMLLEAISRDKAAEMQALWHLDKKLPDQITVEMSDELPLSPYQQVGAEISKIVRNYAFFCEQGTGKTAMAISRICTDARELRERGESRMLRVIVACPKALRLNWKSEIERFSSVEGKTTILRGGAAERVKVLAGAMRPKNENTAFTVLVLSYGFLVESWDSVLQHIPWDLAILDESHKIKAPRSKRTRQCHNLRDNSRNRMILTGTPFTNSVFDLWSQLEFLEKGMTGYTQFPAFKAAFKNHAVDRTNGDMLKEVQRIPEIKTMIAKSAFVVRKDQVLTDLPEKKYDIREVEMVADQASAYKELANTLYLEIEEAINNADSNKIQLVMMNSLTVLLKLSEVTSGFFRIPASFDEYGNELEEARVITFSSNPKMDLLVEELSASPKTEKVIVWAHWRHDVQSICERLKSENIDCVQFYGSTSEADREEALYRFNYDRDCKVFVGSPAAGGVGLNLLGYPPGRGEEYDTNCTRMIYYSQGWSLEHRAQSEDRAHRRGTREDLVITDLVVPDTIDEDIRTRVLNKKKSALEIQDLREILAKVKESI